MRLSTHVLDTARGTPAVGVPVTVEHDGVAVATGVTADGGRWAVDLGAAPGRYALTFEVDSPFFPRVRVDFTVTDVDRAYHVPLLLSPYGYTTYLGS